MSQSYDLRPLWDAILDIYKAIADICERHNLRYYVTGGNCLGAVRHKGFIPWDDDMDVFLPWDDYDKFWEYAKEELPEYWKAVGWWNTPEYPELFGKIQETRREIVDEVSNASGLSLPHGLYVDIFPLVMCPKNIIQKFIWNVSGWTLKLKVSIVLNKGKRHTLKSKFVGLFGCFFSWLYPSLKDNQTAMKIHDRRARKYVWSQKGYCGWYVPSKYNVVSPIPSKFFDGVVYLPFGKIQVPVPSNYLGYLQYKFGDYMKLPPEDKRTPTHGNMNVAPWRFGPTGVDIKENT